jgi:hypothetical protein
MEGHHILDVAELLTPEHEEKWGAGGRVPPTPETCAAPPLDACGTADPPPDADGNADPPLEALGTPIDGAGAHR